MLITGQEVTNVTGVLRMLTVPSNMHFVTRGEKQKKENMIIIRLHNLFCPPLLRTSSQASLEMIPLLDSDEVT